MQCTLYRNATVTFTVEEPSKEHLFEKVIVLIALDGKEVMGRSCTEGAHPFHLHPSGFATLVRSSHQQTIDCPFSAKVAEWAAMKPGTVLGTKERHKQSLEREMKDWFEKLA